LAILPTGLLKLRYFPL